jgi:hypothetical protein
MATLTVPSSKFTSTAETPCSRISRFLTELAQPWHFKFSTSKDSVFIVAVFKQKYLELY